MKKLLCVLMLLLPSEAFAAQRAWITEFATARVEAAGPLANLPALVHQPAIDLSSLASKRSAIFNSGTRYIRVVCDVQCAIQAGTDATNSAIILPAGRPEYFGIQQGTQLISVIAVP